MFHFSALSGVTALPVPLRKLVTQGAAQGLAAQGLVPHCALRRT